MTTSMTTRPNRDTDPSKTRVSSWELLSMFKGWVLRDGRVGGQGSTTKASKFPQLIWAVTERVGGHSTGTEHEGGGSFKYRLQSITEIEDLLSKAQRAAPVDIALVQGNISIGLHQGCRNEYKYNRRGVRLDTV
ncbi:hypothetical protein B0H10DRAFT_1944340 [Mycena sp. CBHHK59/15]|nr:hypothetical protein B0H10DRAFT_1944340 [Mycena sp. CBHHK59/15]